VTIALGHTFHTRFLETERTVQTTFTTIDELANGITDGTRLALAPDYSGCAMDVVRQMMLSRRRGLRLVGVPQMGFQGDMLIGAGVWTGAAFL